MSVPFLEARFDECRTPRWTDATPVLKRMVCGAPVIEGRTYCADCRTVLIAGVVGKDGQPKWFNPSTGTRWRNRPEIAFRDTKALEPDEESTTNETEAFLDAAGLEDAEDTTLYEGEVEPEGVRPLQPADLQDWGMAA